MLNIICLALFCIMVVYHYQTKRNDEDSEDNYPKHARRQGRRTPTHSSNEGDSDDGDGDGDGDDDDGDGDGDDDPVDVQLKVLCLDRSGSMSSFGNEVVEGVNAYLQQVHSSHDNVRWSVVTFDDIIETPVRNTLVKASSTLRKSWVAPRGSTALRDGILSSIKTAQKMITASVGQNSFHVEVVVFTDGMENSSSQISQYDLQAMIKSHKKKGWTFTFLAANQDAIASGASFGFDAGRSLTSSAGRQRNTWKAAASKRKFSKKTRKKCASKKDWSRYGY